MIPTTGGTVKAVTGFSLVSTRYYCCEAGYLQNKSFVERDGCLRPTVSASNLDIVSRMPAHPHAKSGLVLGPEICIASRVPSNSNEIGVCSGHLAGIS